jgi:Leucine-rich repeat (LRR) protein
VIPAEIGALVNLEELYLSDNQISVIQSESGDLVNLDWFTLSDNQISPTSEIINAMQAHFYCLV